jgi:hypothetical protein
MTSPVPGIQAAVGRFGTRASLRITTHAQPSTRGAKLDVHDIWLENRSI